MAASVAAELRKAFKAEAKLIKGSHGIFDVTVDGKKVFSKDAAGRFPNPGEITTLLKKS